jgi:diadenosine tetraphosphatase ApaH/serine/threonine PP2A family protein phosphatase
MLFERYAPVTAERLGPDHLSWLRELPAELAAGSTTVVHASPGDLWRAPPPTAEDAELEATYAALPGRRAVYGHIHRPYARAVGACTVANAGSVGLPWDGDPRASYALVEDERVEIIRVAYDVDAEVRALERSGYPDRDRIAAMLRGGRALPVRPG